IISYKRTKAYIVSHLAAISLLYPGGKEKKQEKKEKPLQLQHNKIQQLINHG
ncbi:MAG: hypothetical protein ACI8RD_008879, partial [Bacillariaceae sp.]